MKSVLLQQTLVNSRPDDLRILNRKKLFALNVTRENADAILMRAPSTPTGHLIFLCRATTLSGANGQRGA
jgi:hypothetical protein